jgi:hypothetical protein
MANFLGRRLDAMRFGCTRLRLTPLNERQNKCNSLEEI